MKKALALVLTMVLTLSLMTVAMAETTGELKFGFVVDTTSSSSKDAGEKDGVAQLNSIAVAVLVDADGKIVDLDTDTAQTKLPFTVKGTLGENFPASALTKRQLGVEYGMTPASPIGKEWDAQNDALINYLIGKTADEIKGIKLDEAGHPQDEDLTAGCTMAIGGIVNAVLTAMENAAPCAAKATDKVGVGVVTTTSKSKDAADGKDGQCMAYSAFTAVTVGEDGVVTTCKMDSTQGTVKFDATGKITSDLSARTTTKQELGEGYAMRAASPIGKEWFEQADALAAYVVGKDAAALEGIALDADNKPTDTELTASVTISVGDMMGSVMNAISYAK